MTDFSPSVIAHRGASQEAPENTIAAFELARKQGCDGIELDVHMSKDGQLVVCHDASVNRTTDGEGRIKDLTVAELKQFDAGSWFDRQYAGEKIPLLEEVLAAIPADITLHIEVKNTPLYYAGMEQKLCDMLEQTNRTDSVVISSFDHQCLARIKQMYSELKIGLLCSVNLVDYVQYTKLFGTADVYAFHPAHNVIQEKDVRALTEHGIRVNMWTVNDPALAKQLMHIGASGIITDNPGQIKQVIS